MKVSEGHLEEEMEALPLAKICTSSPMFPSQTPLLKSPCKPILIAASRPLLSYLELSGGLNPMLV